MTRKQRIYDALSAALHPDMLSVEDESHRHRVPTGCESHFKVIAVSTCFEKQNMVARHRLINHLLATEFATGLHALSLHLYSLEEWKNKQAKGIPNSPPCHKSKQKEASGDF